MRQYIFCQFAHIVFPIDNFEPDDMECKVHSSTVLFLKVTPFIQETSTKNIILVYDYDMIS